MSERWYFTGTHRLRCRDTDVRVELKSKIRVSVEDLSSESMLCQGRWRDIYALTAKGSDSSIDFPGYFIRRETYWGTHCIFV